MMLKVERKRAASIDGVDKGKIGDVVIETKQFAVKTKRLKDGIKIWDNRNGS